MLSTTTARMWAAAVALARTLSADLTASTTTPTWKRLGRDCPAWCAGGHQCTAQHGYAAGQHRSQPMTARTGYGALVATRVAGHPGNQVELRAVVNLPADEIDAGITADRIMTGIHLTITALTAESSPTTIRAKAVYHEPSRLGRLAVGEIGRAA